MLSVAFVIGVQFAVHLTGYFETLALRYQEHSARTDVFSWSTVGEMWETIILGEGPKAKLRSVGISPHNAFIGAHLWFGGITAWPCVVWVIILAVRTYRMVRARDYPWDSRMMLLAVCGMMIGYTFVHNVAIMEPAWILGAAIVEKYSAPYSRRRIMERRMAWYYQRAPEPGAAEAGLPVPWSALTAGPYRA
jgi:hypothetical protein